MKVSNTQQSMPQIDNAPTKAKGSEGAQKSEEKKGIFGFAKDMFSKATSLQFGSIAESICDRIGLPESMGDVAGMLVSLARMDYTGLAEHAADLGKDIAAEKGHTKLAGFLEGFEQKIGTFNQVAGKASFMVGSALATGGAGAALGASTGAVSMGGVSMSAAQMFQGVNMIGGAINAGEALERGDKMGAALGALGILGDIGGMGEVFGMSASQAQGLKTFADKGQTALGVFAKANEDGKIDLNDLKHVPMGEVLKQLGVDESMLDAGQMAMLEGSVGVLGSEDKGNALMNLLTSTVIDRAMDSTANTRGDGQEQDVLSNALSFFSESMQTGQNAPAAMTLLSSLLAQLGHSESAAPARDFQFGRIKV